MTDRVTTRFRHHGHRTFVHYDKSGVQIPLYVNIDCRLYFLGLSETTVSTTSGIDMSFVISLCSKVINGFRNMGKELSTHYSSHTRRPSSYGLEVLSCLRSCFRDMIAVLGLIAPNVHVILLEKT